MNTVFVISVFCTSLGSLALGLIVLLNNKRSATNIAYFLLTFVTFLWLYSLCLVYTAENYQKAILFGKIKYASVVFIPTFFYHFIFSFLGLSSKKQKISLYVFYVMSFIYVILIWFSPLMISGLYKYSWGMYPKGGILSSIFVLWFVLVFLYCFVTLFSYYRKNKSLVSYPRLLQIKWILISFFLSSFAIPDFLPYFGIEYKPLGYIAIALFLLAIAYAILRHRLLDIEVIIKKTLIFTGIFLSAYAIFAFFAFLGQIFFEKFILANRWIAMIPTVIVVTFALRPLETLLISLTDKFLFQKRYDYKELIRTFVSEVLTVLDLNNLIKLTEKKLTEIMKLEYCRMIIGEKASINIEAPLKLPISVNSDSMGMLLLGKKKSDEDYNQDDINILQALAKTLGIAISNAKLVEELGKAQAEAAQKDKMATVGTLVAGMAHEIRNPITTIRVFSEYVPDRLNDDKFRNKYRDIIAKEVDKIDHIIQALIDFSGEEGIKEISSVSLHKATEELISIISQGQDVLGRIRLINNIPPDIARIDINKEELDEIILNLTQNAIHAIADNGTITFSAEEKERSIVLKISDTGCGISEETIKHIFNPFFTTKLKGFGLGLFVVNELIQRNNGKISVKSALNKGTIFYLEFKKII